MLGTALTGSTYWRSLVILGVGITAGALAPILIRMAQDEGVLSPAIATLRMLLATLILTPFVWRYHAHTLRALTPQQVLLAAAAGTIVALAFMAFIFSLQYVSVLVNNVLDGTSPLWVAIFEVLLLKQRFVRQTWLGLGLALIGGLIIALAGSSGALIGENPALGSLLALTSACCFSLYLVIARKVRESLPFLPYIWLVFFFATGVALLITLLSGTALTGYSAKGYFWVLMITLIPQLIAHSAFNYVVKYLSATYISILGQAGVIMAAVFALIFFHEVPGPAQIVGGAIILTGVTLASLRHPTHSQNP